MSATAFLLLLLPLAAAAAETFGPHVITPLTLAVRSACARTDHPDACISAIKPVLAPNAQADVTNVLRLLIKAGKQKTELVRSQFAKAVRDPDTDRTVAMILRGCVEKYASALDDYDSALVAVGAGDKDSAQGALSAALTEYDTCGNGDAPGDPTLDPSSTWGAANKGLMDVASDCLALCVKM